MSACAGRVAIGTRPGYDMPAISRFEKLERTAFEMMTYLRMIVADRTLKIAALGALALAAMGPVSRSQIAVKSESVDTFKRNCAVCHAADGSGTALGNRLNAPDLRSKEVHEKTPAALAQIIITGKNNMPPFGTKLDSEEVQRLVEYIRRFHGDGPDHPK